MIRIVFAIAVLAVTSLSANAQSTPRIFQGTAFITAVSSACSPYFVVGNFFTHVYRQKINSSDLADAMSFASERSLFRILSTESSGSLSGAAATNNLYVNSRSNAAGNLVGSSNLVITSSGGAPVNTANALKYVGTVNDFYGTVGCTVTIRAVGTLRPDL